jgi:inner membrane protein
MRSANTKYFSKFFIFILSLFFSNIHHKFILFLENNYLILAVLIALLSFLFLNKKLLMIFLPLFFVSLFLIQGNGVDYIQIVLAIGLGTFSHIVLDSFTPAGIKLFAPLSSKKVYKNFGLSMIFLLVACSLVYHAPILFNLFESYALFI